MTAPAAAPSRPATRLDVPTIERALDGLLRAILADEEAKMDARTGPPIFQFLSIRDLKAEALPTRAESDILEIAREPIGAACRQAIRRCGESLFRMTGDTVLMSDVIERVADMDPKRSGSRVAIMDSA